MLKVNDLPVMPFREPYSQNNHNSLHDSRSHYRQPPEHHYHACFKDHRIDQRLPDWGHRDTRRDWDYRPDRGRPDMPRDRDYHPDRGYPDMRSDRDYLPDRAYPDMRRDRDYLPDRGYPDMRSDRDYLPDRAYPDMRRDRDYLPDRGYPDMRRDRDYLPDRAYPDMRRDRDYLPDRGYPDMRRDRDYLPDCGYPDMRHDSRLIDRSRPPKPIPENPTLNAIEALLNAPLDRKRNIDHGISANDVRAGKYGKLSPPIIRELNKLKPDQDYRLVTHITENKDSTKWMPINGGEPVLIESRDMQSGETVPYGGSSLMKLRKIESTPIKSWDEGITSDELKEGKYGVLSPYIKKSLDGLEPGKNYSLTTMVGVNPEDGNTMAWVDKITGKFVEIATVDTTPY